jgi:hypothetical protein
MGSSDSYGSAKWLAAITRSLGYERVDDETLDYEQGSKQLKQIAEEFEVPID